MSGEWLMYDKQTWLNYLVMGEYVGLVFGHNSRVGKKNGMHGSCLCLSSAVDAGEMEQPHL